MDKINSKMKMSNVSKYNPICSVIGDKYETTIPEMKIDESDEMNIHTMDNVPVHVKFSPLLDPLKYMSGSYDVKDSNLFTIPSSENDTNSHTKLTNPYNSAYVDALFYNLSGNIMDKYKVPHCIKYYGEYSGIKSEFQMNLDDDIDYINESDFFIKNNGVLFTVDVDTETSLSPIKITEDIELDGISEIDELSGIFEFMKIQQTPESLDKSDTIQLSDDLSDCSSTSSNTADDYNDDGSLSSSDSSSNSDDTSESECNAIINDFPVHAIYIEKCKDTLDSIMDTLTDNEWASVVFQISITLAIYQKLFDFTHNDLHTSNIMYTETNDRFLYYKYMGRHYKIPTYGKVYKIIDFGRAIYKVNGTVIYSDSFESDGDAYGQYNFGPIKTSSELEIFPNNSFDLCRLGCSVYDYIIDDVENGEDTGIKRIMCEWCMDDDGKNILYKKDGNERYPGFKLYKMISRKVNKHTPDNVISKSFFERYIVNKKSIKRNNIIDVDNMVV
jgi:hypothetical protein